MLKMKIINKVKPLKLKVTAEFPTVILAKLQEKSTIPTKNEQEIIPDKNYDGLSKVIVNKIPDEYIVPSGRIVIIENGSYDVTEYAEVEVLTSGGSDFEINDASYLFYNGSRIDDLDYYLSACKNVTTTRYMFGHCDMTSLDLSNLNLSNTNDMSYMCTYCQKLTSLIINGSNAVNVKNMSGFLNNCWALKSFPLNNINTINVEDMNSMCSGCRTMVSANLSNLNMINVKHVQNMFSGCYELSEVIFNDSNDVSIVNAAYMFSYCYKLILLDLSSFDTTNTTNTTYMFSNSGIEKLIINRQDVFKMTNINMFNNTPISNGTGYVYVPDNMVETYKSATNWSNYANQIKPMSELEVV